MNKNKIQTSINELIRNFNLKSFIVKGEQWFCLNDLPIAERTLDRIRAKIKNADTKFVLENTKLWKSSDFRGDKNDTPEFINFNPDSLQNFGENFVKFPLFNVVISNSNSLAIEYKIGISNILDEIRVNGFYIDNNLTDENVEKLKLRLKDAQIKMERITGKWYYLHDLHFDNGVTITVAEQEEIINEVWKNKNGEVKVSAHNKVLTKNGKLMVSEIGIKQMKINYMNRAKQTQKQKSENII